MSVELIESTRQQACALTIQEKSQLAHFLLEQARIDQGLPPLAEQEQAAQKRQQHMEWMTAHREQYAGQYVALDGNRLSGQGRTMAEARQQAIENGVNDPFLVRMTSESEVLSGGW